MPRFYGPEGTVSPSPPLEMEEREKPCLTRLDVFC
jgi:hypothetical protein